MEFLLTVLRYTVIVLTFWLGLIVAVVLLVGITQRIVLLVEWLWQRLSQVKTLRLPNKTWYTLIFILGGVFWWAVWYSGVYETPKLARNLLAFGIATCIAGLLFTLVSYRLTRRLGSGLTLSLANILAIGLWWVTPCLGVVSVVIFKTK